MILEKIRSATEAHHRQLEDTPLLKHFSKRTITLPVYANILEKLYGYFQPVELTLNRFSELSAYLPDYHQRRRSISLVEDLRKVSGLPARFPTCDRLPVINSAARAFGCLYVMEGSALGGRMISSILKEKLGIDNHTGASFFYGYGTETGNKWKMFSESLSVFSKRYGNDNDIVHGAADTFDKLKRWMNTDPMSGAIS
jgi:heme oxygenase (biliverdin-IX-beta and delta-forming)